MKNTLSSSTSSVRTTLALWCALCGVAGLASAEVIGSGHVVSETRAVSGFHGVELRSGGDVVVTQGDTEGLVIDAEDNLLPLIEATVGADGILHLGLKPHTGSVTFHQPVRFKLAVKTLDKMVVAGSGGIRAAALASGRLQIDLPGSGAVTVDHLKADSVKASLEGSGNVKLAGEARSQQITMAGSGDYAAKDFRTDRTSLQIDGSGNGQVWADGSLTVEINGTGNVGYRGEAKLKQSINGPGEVHPLDRKE